MAISKVVLTRLSFLISIAFTGIEAIAQEIVPPAIPGWSSSEDQTLKGIKLDSSGPGYSSPAITEVDGDESDGSEIVLGSADGTVTVLHADGSLLWKQSTPGAACQLRTGFQKLLSSPAVGELFGDGIKYVVIGYGGLDSANPCDGGVSVFRGTDGANIWNFSTKQFARKIKSLPRLYGVFSTPALADTDFDGRMEIGFGSFDRNVYLLNADGTMRWYYNAADTVWSSAAFVNVDRDAKLEMIIGTDISANRRLRPPTKNGGFVYAFKTASRRKKHLTFQQRDAYVWRQWFDQTIYSAPIVADVLKSSPGREVVVGSGCYFPANSTNKKGRWVKVLNLSNGRIIQTLNAATCLSSSPAVGDINNDGTLEVVASVNGSTDVGGDGTSKIQAWNAEIREPLWTVAARTGGNHDTYGGTFQSPVVGDVDGNGSLEVLVANGGGVVIVDGSTGNPLTCAARTCSNLPVLAVGAASKTTPAIGDVNRDGVLDVIFSGAAGRNGFLYGWTHLSSVITSSSGSVGSFAAPWTEYRGNAARDGVYR